MEPPYWYLRRLIAQIDNDEFDSNRAYDMLYDRYHEYELADAVGTTVDIDFVRARLEQAVILAAKRMP